AALGLLSAALGNGVLLKDGDRQVRPNLFILLLADPDPSFTSAFDLSFDALAWQQNYNETCLHHIHTPNYERDLQDLRLEKAGILKDQRKHKTAGSASLRFVDDEIRRMNAAHQR